MKKLSVLILIATVSLAFTACMVDESDSNSFLVESRWVCPEQGSTLTFTSESTGILAVVEYDSESKSNRERQMIFTWLYRSPTLVLLVGGAPYDSGTITGDNLYLHERDEFFIKQ